VTVSAVVLFIVVTPENVSNQLNERLLDNVIVEVVLKFMLVQVVPLVSHLLVHVAYSVVLAS
jgi:hypothetical protein